MTPAGKSPRVYNLQNVFSAWLKEQLKCNCWIKSSRKKYRTNNWSQNNKSWCFWAKFQQYFAKKHVLEKMQEIRKNEETLNEDSEVYRAQLVWQCRGNWKPAWTLRFNPWTIASLILTKSTGTYWKRARKSNKNFSILVMVSDFPVFKKSHPIQLQTSAEANLVALHKIDDMKMVTSTVTL